MNISVFGLGYVGCVSATCLAESGHQVIGVDVNQAKVDFVNRGTAPVVEPGLDALLSQIVEDGRLSATTDAAEAVASSDVSLISVGTPSLPNGSLDLQFVCNVVEQIGIALRGKSRYHVVALRSTTLPGTLDTTVMPLLRESSGKEPGSDFGACTNPEFLREGAALEDYKNPPYTLIGAIDSRCAEVLRQVYADIDAPVLVTEPRTAEMVKYVSNAYHSLKVTFANEIGLLCKAQQIDSHAVMDIFIKDRQLNISEKYLRPGFAFGGSCLPKDLRSLLYRAKFLDLELPVLSSILPSNDQHIEYAVRLVEQAGQRQVGLLGLSFKDDTDDLRESPLLHLAERLLGKGYELKIFDRNVLLSQLTGANKRYLEQTIPHISKLLVDEIGLVFNHARTVIIGNQDPEYEEQLAALDAGRHVIDLVRFAEPRSGIGYNGICW